MGYASRRIRMKRVIPIPSAKIFVLLHQGFVVGGQSQKEKSISTVRSEAKILDKIDLISTESVDTEGKLNIYPSGDPVRVLAADNSDLVLTPDEYMLVKRYVESVPWSTSVSRDVVTLLDLIDSATERPDDAPNLRLIKE